MWLAFLESIWMDRIVYLCSLLLALYIEKSFVVSSKIMSLKLKGNPSISVNIFSKLYLLIYDEIKRSTDKWTKIVVFVISPEQHLQGRLENNNVLSMRKSTAPIDAVKIYLFLGNMSKCDLLSWKVFEWTELCIFVHCYTEHPLQNGTDHKGNFAAISCILCFVFSTINYQEHPPLANAVPHYSVDWCSRFTHAQKSIQILSRKASHISTYSLNINIFYITKIVTMRH
jgi:hypothetical protein